MLANGSLHLLQRIETIAARELVNASRRRQSPLTEGARRSEYFRPVMSTSRRRPSGISVPPGAAVGCLFVVTGGDCYKCLAEAFGLGCSSAASLTPFVVCRVPPMKRIPDDDWKTWRLTSAVALERFCAEALERVRALTLREGSAHTRYRELFAFLRERDDIIVAIFNDQRRSNAYLQMARALSEGVIHPNQIAKLSDESQAKIRMIVGIESES